MKNSSHDTKALAYVILWAVIALIVLIGLGWLLAGNSLMMRGFFAPKVEQVNREVFEQSKAYRDGMAQELRSLQLEYTKADDKVKPAIASLILHKSAGVPQDALPPDLQAFISSLTSTSTSTKGF